MRTVKQSINVCHPRQDLRDKSHLLSLERSNSISRAGSIVNPKYRFFRKIPHICAAHGANQSNHFSDGHRRGIAIPTHFVRANRATSSKPARFIRHRRRFADFPARQKNTAAQPRSRGDTSSQTGEGESKGGTASPSLSFLKSLRCSS